MPVKECCDEVDVAPQVVSSETPAARPQERAREVVGRKTPPRHLHHPGGDAVHLPQAIEKAGQENDDTTAALEKILEVLLPLRVAQSTQGRGSDSR